ncbi:MAG TPA: hypothetical protein VKU00_01515 [Chthonomonadaceae bacterium]|nr:hypothetical protein [Chthonomonadaceae bacterium]
MKLARPGNPDFATSQFLPECLQCADLIIDPVHPLVAIFVLIDHEGTIRTFDDPVQGNLDVGRIELDFTVGVLLDQFHRVQDRTMRGVVGAKLQAPQDGRHHPAIVVAIGVALYDLHLLAITHAGGVPLGLEVL